jgi:hypothetical protein
MTSDRGSVVSEELPSIFMVVQEEGMYCSKDECSKLFGNVACIQLYIASYSRSLKVQVGHAVAQLVEALCYKPEGRGFDSRWCH